MFSVSERLHAAAQFLAELARIAPGRLTLREAQERCGVSLAYLEEIAASLRAAGLIDGRQGPRGGYTLAKPAGEVTLYDVACILEGPLALVACQREHLECPLEHACSTRSVWGRIQLAVAKELKSTTLSTLAALKIS